MTREEILNMPADREMDKLIAENVLNLPPCDKWTIQRHYPVEMINDNTCEHHGKCYPKEIPCFYSTNIAAAWEVVEWLQKNGYSFELTEHADPQGDYILQVWRRDMECNDFIARAESAPLAICRAALLAVMKVEPA